MVKKTAVPDAWEDDWETQADKAAQEPEPEPQSEAPRTKAERLAYHTETNRKLWESADTSKETFHYLESNTSANSTPLTSNFKPQVKVLSRKPVIAKRDPATGMSRLTLDDDAEDEDANAAKEPQPTPEEIRARQKRERDEKQRRYDEARAKIFGESNPSSGASSPGTVTPPRSEGRHTPQGGIGGAGRGRGRAGGAGGYRNNDRSGESRQSDSRRTNMPSASASGRELYDPNFSPKPDLPGQQRRGGDTDYPSRSSTPKEHAPIRAPRGPDGSGRGGFGFARRGGQGG